MNITINKKSGKGNMDGVVSELTAFFHVKPGCEEPLRKELAKFVNVLHTTDPKETQKTGLRDTRHVLFDNGTRLLWATSFETDWDPYLDEALIIVGAENFASWMIYLEEAEELMGWFQGAGGKVTNGKANLENVEEFVRVSGSGLKAIIQSAQIPAAVYWNALANLTTAQIDKAEDIEQAFQQVLDNPDAGEPLQHPAMQPLLAQASV